MYKLIAIDLDGTLLNSYGQISEKNKLALNNAKEKGIQIVLASGRTTDSVKSIANEIGVQNYIICGNGSLIYDLQKEEIIYDKFIEKKKALQIIDICEKNSIYYNIYTENMVIAKTLNNNVLFYYQENANKPDNKKTKINIVQDIYEYVKNLENQILGAEEKVVNLEYNAFTKVRESIENQIQRLQKSAHLIATLDVLCSLATVAEDYNYNMPIVDEKGIIDIKDGRHPVIEKMLPTGSFVRK